MVFHFRRLLWAVAYDHQCRHACLRDGANGEQTEKGGLGPSSSSKRNIQVLMRQAEERATPEKLTVLP